jgi:hypothetical protein
MVLGSGKNSKPEYSFTVQLRILNNKGEVVYKGENPLVSMFKPKTENKAVDKELVIFLNE